MTSYQAVKTPRGKSCCVWQVAQMGTWGFHTLSNFTFLLICLRASASSAASPSVCFEHKSTFGNLRLWVMLAGAVTCTGVHQATAATGSGNSGFTAFIRDHTQQFDACCKPGPGNKQSVDLQSEQALSVTTLNQLLLQECPKPQCWEDAQRDL